MATPPQPLEGLEKRGKAAPRTRRGGFGCCVPARDRYNDRVFLRQKHQLAWTAAATVLGIALSAFPPAAQAAEVTLDIAVARKPYVLFQGKPRPASEFIAAIARRSHAGETAATIRLAYPGYRVLGEREPDGSYRIVRESVALDGPATVRVRMSIEYPKLSDAQHKALRGKKDYRLLYGFVRGIVEHEELHVREFVKYARAVRQIIASPPLGENPAVRPSEAEDVAAVLRQYVNDRIGEALDAAEVRSTAAQQAIDATGKTSRIAFRFVEPVKGAVPAILTYATRAKIRVLFAMPKGTPRPPEPRTVY